MASTREEEHKVTSVWPVWADDEHLNCQWLIEKTGLAASSSGCTCSVTDISNALRRGSTPREGATLLLTLASQEQEPQRLVLKQVASSGLSLSQQLGLAREALFYKHLAPLLASSANESRDILPHIYYSAGDIKTGEKCILMEDLSSWMDSGIFFGPGNPNNWSRDLPALLHAAYGNTETIVPSPRHVAERTFRAVARIHATFWSNKIGEVVNDINLLDEQCSWLRGHAWLQGKGRETWEASQRLIQDIWSIYCAKEQEEAFRWDPLVRAATDKAVSGISWEKQLERLNVNQHWTLVHGDFWPGNVLWKTVTAADDSMNFQTNPIRLVDWEMVGLGSGPQDLGQYVLSNMDPADRRGCERELVQAYYDALCEAGVNMHDTSTEAQGDARKVTFDYCWEEYRVGGVERFLWFLIYFLGQPNALQWAQFFHDQIAAFMRDHGLSEQDITQPRP